MPRTYNCKRCGDTHEPPTGKQCSRIRQQEQNIAGQADGVMPMLLELKEQFQVMSQQMAQMQNKDSSSANDDSYKDSEADLEQSEPEEQGAVGGQPATASTLRQDVRIMSQAARRLARLRLDDSDDDDMESYNRRESDRRALGRAARRRREQAYRPGTVANRTSHGLIYIAFTIYFHFPDFPATVRGLLCFAEFMLRTYTAAKSVLNVLASVKVLHVEAHFETSAFQDIAVVNWRRALPLTLRTTVNGAPSLPLEALSRFCKLAHSLGTKGKVFATLLSVSFFAMARISSLLPTSLCNFDVSRSPCLADITFTGNECLIYIKWAKNAQLTTQGYTVPLVGFQVKEACPVTNLRWLLQALRRFPLHTPLFTFPATRGHGGRASQGGFTIRLAREWLKTFNCLAGTQGVTYTFHSFRRGACSLAFERGAELSDLKQLGGWRSDAVASYYPAVAARRRAAAFLQRPN